MTNYFNGSYSTDERTMSGPGALITVSILSDPRTDAGLTVAAGDHTTIRGHVALVSARSDNKVIVLRWIEKPSVGVFLQGDGVSRDELIKVAEGMSGFR